MDFAWFLPLLGFALITCGTPGPNNMLLTAAGANLGFRASMPTLVAVVSGLNLIMLATALGLGVVFASQPMLHQGLRIIGSGYLLWLAWKLARAGEPGERRESEMPRWHQAAFLQLLSRRAGALSTFLNSSSSALAASSVQSARRKVWVSHDSSRRYPFSVSLEWMAKVR